MFWPVFFTLFSLPALADVDALKLVPGGKIKSKTSFEIVGIISKTFMKEFRQVMLTFETTQPFLHHAKMIYM